MYNNPSTSLIHVMNLFEEKNIKYSPLPLSMGPLPIKANGAIVVNRPTLLNNDSDEHVNYITTEDNDDEQQVITRNSSSISCNSSHSNHSLNNTSNTSIHNFVMLKNEEEEEGIEEEEEEEEEEVEEEGEENKDELKLVQLLSVENSKIIQENEQYKKDLAYANQRIKNLERIILTTSSSTKESRRQSTNSISILNESAISNETKIKILLNEIEAMDQEYNQYKIQYEKVTAKLKQKQDVINQLTVELKLKSE